MGMAKGLTDCVRFFLIAAGAAGGGMLFVRVRDYCLLITEFIEEDSPFCLIRAITRAMIDLCYTLLSLVRLRASRTTIAEKNETLPRRARI